MCVRVCLVCFDRAFSTVDEGAPSGDDPVFDVIDDGSTVPLGPPKQGGTGMGALKRASFSRTEKEKKEREEEERRNALHRMPANMASFASFPFHSCPALSSCVLLFFVGIVLPSSRLMHSVDTVDRGLFRYSISLAFSDWDCFSLIGCVCFEFSRVVSYRLVVWGAFFVVVAL